MLAQRAKQPTFFPAIISPCDIANDSLDATPSSVIHAETEEQAARDAQVARDCGAAGLFRSAPREQLLEIHSNGPTPVRIGALQTHAMIFLVRLSQRNQTA